MEKRQGNENFIKPEQEPEIEVQILYSLSQILDGAWMDRAKCKPLNTEIFFPTDGVGVEKAKSICSGCAVREPCLEYALLNGIKDGVWGGTSERERRRIARERKAS